MDLDTPALGVATVTITDVATGDRLAADTTGTGITASYDPGTGVLTLTGLDTLANYQTVLRSVAYESLSDNPTNGGADTTRTLAWLLDDGEAANNLSAITNSTIVITAVNDPATITGITAATWSRPAASTTARPALRPRAATSIPSTSTARTTPGRRWRRATPRSAASAPMR